MDARKELAGPMRVRDEVQGEPADHQLADRKLETEEPLAGIERDPRSGLEPGPMKLGPAQDLLPAAARAQREREELGQVTLGGVHRRQLPVVRAEPEPFRRATEGQIARVEVVVNHRARRGLELAPPVADCPGPVEMTAEIQG